MDATSHWPFAGQARAPEGGDRTQTQTGVIGNRTLTQSTFRNVRVHTPGKTLPLVRHSPLARASDATSPPPEPQPLKSLPLVRQGPVEPPLYVQIALRRHGMSNRENEREARLRIQSVVDAERSIQDAMSRHVAPHEKIKMQATCLDLSGLSLIIVPDQIAYTNSLLRLNISANFLSTLTPTITNCTDLIELKLSKNKIRELSPDICKLRRLLVLCLDSNELADLPADLEQLRLLQVLDLANNCFDKAPAPLFALGKLSQLSLEGNRLSTLPLAMHRLSNLTRLDLSGNQFSTLPLVVCELSQLIYLHVDRNDLTCIPPHIIFLQQLTKLTLSNNPRLESLPISLGRIPTLTSLDITNTKIPPHLPVAILEQARALRTLSSDPALHYSVATWKAAAQSPIDLSGLEQLSEQTQHYIDEWLRKLELSLACQNDQQNLAASVCNLLLGVIQKENFRSIFLTQITQDYYTPMITINHLYASWFLELIPQFPSQRDRLHKLKCAAKTLALHDAIKRAIVSEEDNLSPKDKEKIHLYYETRLKGQLKTLSVVEQISEEGTEQYDWIKEQDLIEEVGKNYMEKLTALPLFQTILETTPPNEIEALWKAIEP